MDEAAGKLPSEDGNPFAPGNNLGAKAKTRMGQQVLLENPEWRHVHSPASLGGLVSSAASTIACEA